MADLNSDKKAGFGRLFHRTICKGGKGHLHLLRSVLSGKNALFWSF